MSGTLDKELENWVNWVREIFDQRTDETPKELMESFKLNLYQDEIYVFTPKGDLKILPKGATPIDFGFEIHSNVGSHTIGAKVNGRIVPLNTILQSGDQVEIITSKKQTPNADWEKFAVTHKAKSAVRHWIKEEERKHIEEGKELWDKKIKKAKLHINDDELTKFVHLQRINNTQDFYLGITTQTVDPDAMIGLLIEKTKRPTAEQEQKGKMALRCCSTALSKVLGVSRAEYPFSALTTILCTITPSAVTLFPAMRLWVLLQLAKG